MQKRRFFFSSRRRHTRCSRDWSSDVCSSDLNPPSGGFTAAVTFSVSGLPGGATASFSPNPATASSTMTRCTGHTTPPHSHALTITRLIRTLTRTTSVTLTVNPAPVPDFTLSATPASQSVVQGAGTTYTVSITPSGGFTTARAHS